MTHLGPETVVSFVGTEHLDSVLFSGSYGVLRGRVAMVIGAIMFALVFVGGANACHHNAETAEQTSTEVPQKTEKTEIEA